MKAKKKEERREKRKREEGEAGDALEGNSEGERQAEEGGGEDGPRESMDVDDVGILQNLPEFYRVKANAIPASYYLPSRVRLMPKPVQEKVRKAVCKAFIKKQREERTTAAGSGSAACCRPGDPQSPQPPQNPIQIFS